MSLAYEVLAMDDTIPLQPAPQPSCSSSKPIRSYIRARGYDVVRQPSDSPLDPESFRIHRIDVPTSRRTGRPLRAILTDLAAIVREHRPTAVVGHDIQGDISLLISECVRSNLDPNAQFGDWLRRLICTKIGAVVPCGIPLPPLRHGTDGGTRRLKWPNLDECYERLCCVGAAEAEEEVWGGGGEGWPVHDARGDVERCRAVFLCLMRNQTPVLQPIEEILSIEAQ